MKNFLKSLTIASLMFSIIGCASSENDYPSDSVIQNEHHRVHYRAQADKEGDANNQLYANETYKKLIKGLSIKKGQVEVLPDFFGGAYTDNKGVLHVLVKDVNKIHEIRKIIDDESYVDYVQCLFSWNELEDLMDTICKRIYESPKELQRNVSLFYVQDSENRIVVGLRHKNEETIKAFRESILNHPSVEFTQVKSHEKNSGEFFSQLAAIPPFFYYSDVRPGSYFAKNSSTSFHASWAFRARDVQDTTIVGMVTAAHAATCDSVFIGGVYFGEPQVPYHSPDVDAVFVQLNQELMERHRFRLSNSLETNYVEGEYPYPYNVAAELHTDTNLPVSGTIVNKRGWKTGPTTGEIVSTNFCETLLLQDGSLYVVNNMTSVELDSDNGDSGGIVYTYYSNNNKRYTTGILCGNFIDEIGSEYAYFTKANVALSRIGIERY